MGSPVSPIIANMFMEIFQSLALSSFASALKFSGRYIDDTMFILKRLEVDDFVEYLNSIHPAIKFTVEHEQDNPCWTFSFTKIQDVSLSFSVYRKSTHTDQYLHFDSHQPLEHKLGVICTLKHRANTISSNQDSLEHELSHNYSTGSPGQHHILQSRLPGTRT